MKVLKYLLTTAVEVVFSRHSKIILVVLFNYSTLIISFSMKYFIVESLNENFKTENIFGLCGDCCDGDVFLLARHKHIRGIGTNSTKQKLFQFEVRLTYPVFIF